MSFTETIAAARAFARARRAAARAQPGAAGRWAWRNVAGGLLGAMPAGGGTTQTAVNRKAGARTQVAELVTAAAAVATLLLLRAGHRADAAGGTGGGRGRVFVRSDQASGVRAIRRVRRIEFALGARSRSPASSLLGTLKGILVAVIASLLALAQQAYNPPVYAVGRKRGTQVFRPLSSEHPTTRPGPGC